MGQSPNPDWMNQWQGLQGHYMNAWQDMARAAGMAPPAVAAPSWPDGFEQWSRLFGAGGGAQGGTIERMVDSAKSYAAFMQSMLSTNAAQMPGIGAAPWSELLRQSVSFPGAMPTAATNLFDNPLLHSLRDMAGQAGNPFATMMAGARMPATPDLGELKSLLGLPAFGLRREQQEHQQQTALAFIEVHEQMARYSALMLTASKRGFALFEGKLAAREEPGRQIDSLRALYDLWVDAAEEGYAEVALSVEFREVYGAMVNAQMKLRSLVNAEVERLGAEFGMPTRSEVDSIGERLQALRREVRGAGRKAGGEFAGELAALRREFAALRASLGETPAKARVRDEKAKAAPSPAVVEPAQRKKRRSSTRPAPKATNARGGPAAAPATATRKRKQRKGKQGERAVAATAVGNFASRIASFADASLGATPSALRAKKRDKAKAKSRSKSKKKP